MKRAVAAVALVSLTAAADPPAPRDWAGALRQDARAFHDLIAEDHPGPHNALDPGFAARNDAGLRLALERARVVKDFPGYLWAMRGYVAGFDDGHVQFQTLEGAPALPARWPGFLTGLDGRGRQVVRTRADDAPVPLGAELVACDGVPADRLLARNVGAFTGRWQLAAMRGARAGRLFVDTGNPFIRRPATCRFSTPAGVRSVTLGWRVLDEAERSSRIDETAPSASPPIEARRLADGTRWYSLSSFASDPSGPAARAINPMVEGIRADRAAVLAAPRIVLDVRGNGGGSSEWSRTIARALWGDAVVAALPESRSYVEWRASRANLATIEGYRTRWEVDPAASADALVWARRNAAGLADALAKGQALWREPDWPTPPKSDIAAAAPVAPLAIPVYVLTDWTCASACLDAVDLWTALGAVTVGQDTSADTLYMEVSGRRLPSGLSAMGVPMKVYRGRARGNNQAVAPRHRYTGDMRDTPAIERWIAGLAATGEAGLRRR